MQKLAAAANRGVEPWSLAGYRVLFGILTFWSSARFLAEGWVHQFFGEPSYFFHYFGFSWIPVGGPQVMTGVFICLLILSTLITVGLFYRFAIVAFFFLFTFVELTDVTNYLNHYYLVSLLSFWMIWLPANQVWSLDARMKKNAPRTIPAWCIWVLRWQVGLVYFYAAIAKLQGDWLLHGQPLNIWLMSQSDFPIIGNWFTSHSTAMLMSWAGFLNDLVMAPALLWRKTRWIAYPVVVVFHILTGELFNIGMFPYIMIMSATIFFEPNWPRKVLGLTKKFTVTSPDLLPPLKPTGTWVLVLIMGYCILHAAIPMRSAMTEGPVIWHECGMRFSWKVKVREKNGALNYRVVSPSQNHKELVSPERYLTRRQAREIATQPDLILQLAHHIGHDFRSKGMQDVEVYADSFVSLNGRKEVRLIRETQNLMRVEDSLFCPDWIEPAPEEPPPHLEFNPKKRFKRRS